MTEEERLKIAVRLRETSRRSVEARDACVQICASHGVASMGQLAVEHPQVFDVVAPALLDMEEQLPWA